MSRRDTIILAVLINASLLSILFFTATRPDYETSPIIAEAPRVAPSLSSHSGFSSMTTESSTHSIDIPIPASTYTVREEVAETPISRVFIVDSEPVHTPQPHQIDTDDDFVEVTVKRGDFLEKIARSNGTTVSEVKRINNLMNDRIDVGQVLLVPGRKTSRPSQVAVVQPVVHVEDAEYYVIKAGDNPWNLAREHRVNFDELLRLNNLDEGKARNLKPGDKIRVK
ncbi:MAG: LysM peptidoglycan-binding domain-containing protein [Chlamydiales bacterium]|nr:LysM peptidoglycan-binding domain-containing protein [Chlamydiales bacterium]